MKPFKGLIPAAFTPLDAAGKLALDRIPDLIALYEEAAIRCAFVGGTTGEFSSLSIDERERLTEAWITAAPPALDVWVHVGDNSQTNAIRLATQAGEMGAGAISALAPAYFKPSTPESLVDFLAPIAGAAPDTPFYYYEIPSMTGVSFPPERVLALALERIPTFAGLKFSSHDLFRLQNCLADAPQVDILFGSDEMLLAALALGANGAIGSTYNVAAPLYHRLIAAFEAGNLEEARRLQAVSARFVRVLLDFGVLPAQKAILAMLGVDCGPVLPPLKPLDDQAARRLRERLQAFDIFPRPFT